MYSLRISPMAATLLLLLLSGCGGGDPEIDGDAVSANADSAAAPPTDQNSQGGKLAGVPENIPTPQVAPPPAEPEDPQLRLIYRIRQRPWDERPLLEFADWLEDSDRPRAELIRVQVQLAKLDYDDPNWSDLNQQERRLLDEHRPRWIERLKPLGDAAESAVIRFGLIESLELEHATDEQLKALEGLPELRRLTLRFPELSLEGFASISRLPNLDGLIIEEARFTPEHFAQLEKLPPWTMIELYDDELDQRQVVEMNERRIAPFRALSPEQKLSAAARYLAQFDYFERLGDPPVAAELGQSGITDPEMLLLSGIPGLKRVDISESDITSQGIAHLAGLTEIEDLGLWETKVESIAPLAGLTKLRILGIYPEYDTKMGDDGVAVIENFVHLEELFLNDEAITGATIKRLSPLTKLRTLNVSFDRVESEDSFAALDGLTQLESLSLHGAGIGDAALAHLAGMQKLESLNLLVDHGSGDGFRHLAGLPQLKYLYLTGEGANDTAIAQLAGLAELRTIQAQDGFITKAAAERLAAQLPRVTIILDKDVVKSPRKSYPFERRKFSDTVSLLVPSDWHSEGNAQEYIALREDGWERVGGWSGEFVGPAELRMHRSDDSSSAQEAMLAAVNNNAHLDPKVLEQDVQAMSGSDDTASCTYQNRFALHLVSAAKTDAGHIVLTGQAPPSRFADFEALFKSVARSVRIGNDPALHAEQTLDIPAEELQADRERP